MREMVRVLLVFTLVLAACGGRRIIAGDAAGDGSVDAPNVAR